MPREVVARDKLVAVLDDFLKPFRETQKEWQKARDEIPREAAEYLAQETGKTVHAVARALRRIKNENTSAFVRLETADWIVTAGMGRPDLFHTDLEIITISENPWNKWMGEGLCLYSEVEFAVEELCSQFGSIEAARQIGVSYRTLSRWRRGEHRHIYKTIARRIRETLLEVRNGNGPIKT